MNIRAIGSGVEIRQLHAGRECRRARIRGELRFETLARNSFGDEIQLRRREISLTIAHFRARTIDQDFQLVIAAIHRFRIEPECVGDARVFEGALNRSAGIGIEGSRVPPVRSAQYIALNSTSWTPDSN